MQKMFLALLGLSALVKLALLASLAAIVPGVALAAEPQCGGTNIVETLAAERPEALARIEKRAAEMPNGEGRFWRIGRDGVAPSYLFGTMHVTDPRVTALPQDVETALRGSRVVALELQESGDDAAMQQAASTALGAMVYLDGTSLSDRIDDATEATLREALRSRPQMPWAVANRMKPWVVLGALAVPVCETARKGAGTPVLDSKIARIAASESIPVVGLETVPDQLRMLDSLPEDAMITALEGYARMGDRLEDVFETTVALYAEGRIGVVWALLRDPVVAGEAAGGVDQTEALAAFERVAIEARNRTQLASALPLVGEGGAFIAVGALHLPGRSGLVEGLRAKGWTLTRLD